MAMINLRKFVFIRIIALILYTLSIIIIPFLIGFSYYLKDKIDLAYKEYGVNETIKLINMWGIFGLLTIIFKPKKKKSKKNS